MAEATRCSQTRQNQPSNKSKRIAKQVHALMNIFFENRGSGYGGDSVVILILFPTSFERKVEHNRHTVCAFSVYSFGFCFYFAEQQREMHRNFTVSPSNLS